MPYLVQGLLLPFAGTTAGAACVLFWKRSFQPALQTMMNGFAAGVMVAASIWGLLIPAMDRSAHLGVLSFVPAAAGFWSGILFLLIVDWLAKHLQKNLEVSNVGALSRRTALLVFAVTLHNVPEGLAVGVAFAGWWSKDPAVTLAGAFALSIGIAVQNFPEGAIVSMPLRAGGMSRCKAFVCGALSGLVEPVAAAAAVWAAGRIVPALPYLLSFAAGAMIFVVVQELLPGLPGEQTGCRGSLCFAAGFTLMLALDVALG